MGLLAYFRKLKLRHVQGRMLAAANKSTSSTAPSPPEATSTTADRTGYLPGSSSSAPLIAANNINVNVRIQTVPDGSNAPVLTTQREVDEKTREIQELRQQLSAALAERDVLRSQAAALEERVAQEVGRNGRISRAGSRSEDPRDVCEDAQLLALQLQQKLDASRKREHATTQLLDQAATMLEKELHKIRGLEDCLVLLKAENEKLVQEQQSVTGASAPGRDSVKNMAASPSDGVASSLSPPTFHVADAASGSPGVPESTEEDDLAHYEDCDDALDQLTDDLDEYSTDGDNDQAVASPAPAAHAAVPQLVVTSHDDVEGADADDIVSDADKMDRTNGAGHLWAGWRTRDEDRDFQRNLRVQELYGWLGLKNQAKL